MKFYPFYLCLTLAIITTSCEKEDVIESESSIENFSNFEKLSRAEAVQISPSNFEVNEPASFFVPVAINDNITFTAEAENDEVLVKAFIPSSTTSTFNTILTFSDTASVSTEIQINGVSLIERFPGSALIRLLIDRSVEVLANGDSIVTFRLKAANGSTVTGQEIRSFTGKFQVILTSKKSAPGPTNGGGSGGNVILREVLDLNL